MISHGRTRVKEDTEGFSLDMEDRNGYSSHMKTATLTETKNQLSALIDQVRHGETILILDRGRAVA